MTTILYDHPNRKIAVDGRVSSRGMINTEKAEKWVKDGDDVWFICGPISDRRRLINHINATDPEAPKWPIKCDAFLVRKNNVYLCTVTSEGEPSVSKLNYSHGIGSGGMFALASLDHFDSVTAAVAYAATRDADTGGKMHVFDVAQMEFVVDSICF